MKEVIAWIIAIKEYLDSSAQSPYVYQTEYDKIKYPDNSEIRSRHISRLLISCWTEIIVKLQRMTFGAADIDTGENVDVEIDHKETQGHSI